MPRIRNGLIPTVDTTGHMHRLSKGITPAGDAQGHMPRLRGNVEPSSTPDLQLSPGTVPVRAAVSPGSVPDSRTA